MVTTYRTVVLRIVNRRRRRSRRSPRSDRKTRVKCSATHVDVLRAAHLPDAVHRQLRTPTSTVRTPRFVLRIGPIVLPAPHVVAHDEVLRRDPLLRRAPRGTTSPSPPSSRTAGSRCASPPRPCASWAGGSLVLVHVVGCSACAMSALTGTTLRACARADPRLWVAAQRVDRVRCHGVRHDGAARARGASRYRPPRCRTARSCARRSRSRGVPPPPASTAPSTRRTTRRGYPSLPL